MKNQLTQFAARSRVLLQRLVRLFLPTKIEKGQIWVFRGEENNPWREWEFEVLEVSGGFVLYRSMMLADGYRSKPKALRVSTFKWIRSPLPNNKAMPDGGNAAK